VLASSRTVLQPSKMNPDLVGFEGALTVLPEKKLPSEIAEPPFALNVTA
jgi:hypothetical protein